MIWPHQKKTIDVEDDNFVQKWFPKTSINTFYTIKILFYIIQKSIN